MVSSNRGILWFEGIELLVRVNGFDAVLKFVRSIVDISQNSEWTILIVGAPGTMDEEQWARLRREAPTVDKQQAIEKNIDDTSERSYRSEYPGQYSSKSGKLFYSKSEGKNDLDWGGLKPVSNEASFKLGSLQRQVLQLPKSGILFFFFLLSLALGLVALTERGPFLFLFPIAFIIAFAFPGLIWVSYIYSRTVTSPEPQRLVLIALAWGMFSTLPASLLNDLGSRIVEVNQNALLGKGDFGTPELILVSVIAPFVEELLKPIGLIFIIKRLKTPYEGVLYGVACGMGFAIIENMLYELFILLWYGSDAWTLNAFVRGIGSTVLHAVGPAAIGFAFAYSKQMEKSMKMPLVYAYIFGFIMHAAWNGFATLPLLKENFSLNLTIKFA